MSKLTIPAGYRPPLSVYELQRAIEFIKSNFQVNLSNALNLRRVSAPLFVEESSGLNDNLNAVYVDQWDWEKVITREDRCESYLRRSVRDIVGAICETNDALGVAFPCLHTKLSRDVFFITTQELEDMYPDKTPKERENALLREHPTVFLMQIGGKLRSGKPHDGRAPDYDDWSLNGDILMWNSVLECAFEVSSMGIRVDAASLDRQLTLAGCDDRRSLPFHKMLLNDELPLTMGGGIGQSRLCMLMIGTCHIGEVQSSLWDRETGEACRKAGILLL